MEDTEDLSITSGQNANIYLLSGSDDMYAPESIELLTKSGINFKRHEDYGISVEAFGELLISSGLVLLEEVQWVSFHR